jgi:hypothetical protein
VTCKDEGEKKREKDREVVIYVPNSLIMYIKIKQKGTNKINDIYIRDSSYFFLNVC